MVDPGGPRIDDRHAGEHVRLVDPVAELCRGDRKLRAGVDAERRELVGTAPRRGPPTVGDQVGDRVGEVQLALGVVRIELLERRPERAGGEDVGRGVELPDLALLRRSVPVLDDRFDASVVAADDPAVRERPHRLEREDRHRGVLASHARRRVLPGARRSAAAPPHRARTGCLQSRRARRGPRRRNRRCRAAAPEPRPAFPRRRPPSRARRRSRPGRLRPRGQPRSPSRSRAGRAAGAGASARTTASASRARLPSLLPRGCSRESRCR